MIDAAIKIVGANFRVLFVMAACFVLPFQIAIALAQVSVTDDLSTAVTKNSLPKFNNAQLGAFGASTVLGLISTVVVTGALSWFVAEYYVGRSPRVGESLRVAARRTPATLGSYLVTFVGALVLSVPAIALIVIGAVANVPVISIVAIIAIFPLFFWFFFRCSCAVPSIIVEHLGPVQSVRRSFGLVKGFWWKVFGTQIVTTFLLGIVAAVIQAIIVPLLSKLGGSNAGFEFLWLAIGGTISSAITSPVSAAIAVLLYLDLRIRKEGFDLEVLASSLDGARQA